MGALLCGRVVADPLLLAQRRGAVDAQDSGRPAPSVPGDQDVGGDLLVGFHEIGDPAPRVVSAVDLVQRLGRQGTIDVGGVSEGLAEDSPQGLGLDLPLLDRPDLFDVRRAAPQGQVLAAFADLQEIVKIHIAGHVASPCVFRIVEMIFSDF